MANILNNTTSLQEVLEALQNNTLNQGADTSDATAAADEIFAGKTAYIADGKVDGTFTIENELNEQDELLNRIETLVRTKASPLPTNVDIDPEAITWKTIEAKDSVVLNDISEFNHTVEMQLKPKNLFNVYAVIGNSKAVNNLDGSITILDGNSYTAVAPNSLKDYAPGLEVGKTYTLSAVTTGAKKQIYLGASKYAWTFGTARTIIETDLESVISFYGDGTGTTVTISNIQIEEGNSPSAYTPYIYSPTEDELNFLNKDTIVIGGVGYSTGQLATTNTNLRTDAYSIEPNTIYYAGTGSYLLNTAHTYDADGNWIGRAQVYGSTAFLTQENAVTVRLTYRKSDTSVITAEDLEAFKQENLYVSKVAGLPYLKNDFSGEKVYRYGKNLLPYPYTGKSSQTTNGVTFTVLSDGGIHAIGEATSTAYFRLHGILSHINVSKTLYPNSSIDNYVSRDCWYNPNNSVTVNVYPEDGYVDKVFYPQIEIGNYATKYEPYIEPIEVMVNADGVAIISSACPMTVITNYASNITYQRSFGFDRCEDDFWGNLQDYGNSKDYIATFGAAWTEETFKPKYDFIPTNAYMMFRSNTLKIDLEQYLTNLGVKLDLSKATNLQYLFYNSAFTRIGLVDATSCINATVFDSTFNNCKNLITIDKIILRTGSTAEFNSAAFNGCSALENITMEGQIKKSGLNMKSCTKLSKASIENIISCLSTESTGQSITLSQTAVKKAFETSSGANDGNTSAEWTTLANTRSNWTISLA